MKYLITSIKEIEDLITPSLEIDDFFNPFALPKLEEQFRSCMRLFRIETSGEDFEKYPITFDDFNPKYDKFYGLNYNLLEETIDFDEFKNELKLYNINCEDSYLRDIIEQLQNPIEAQFKMFLHGTLKNLQESYEFLFTSEIKNNALLNIIKVELLESYKRVFDKVRNEVPVYNDIFNTFLLGNKNLNTVEILATNVSISDQDINPYPRIFSDNNSFLFFEELKKIICNDKATQLADFSFVFRKMQKDGYIFHDVSEKSFRDFLNNNYEISFDKLKTYEYSCTNKKIQLYNSLKK